MHVVIMHVYKVKDLALPCDVPPPFAPCLPLTCARAPETMPPMTALCRGKVPSSSRLRTASLWLFRECVHAGYYGLVLVYWERKGKYLVQSLRAHLPGLRRWRCAIRSR